MHNVTFVDVRIVQNLLRNYFLFYCNKSVYDSSQYIANNAVKCNLSKYTKESNQMYKLTP